MLLRRESIVSLMLEKQHLGAASGGDVSDVLDDLLGCHATVPLSPYLQLRARMPTFTPERLDGLLEDGHAAKIACMRRTLFIESAELVPLMLTATRELAAQGRQRFLAANGFTLARYARLADRVAEQLTGRALSARQLRHALRAAEPISPVLIVMCDEARLVRWKGRRGWRSAQPTYRRFEEALPGVRLDVWEEGAAVLELVERYVRRYGPVTETDIAWWTGFSKATVRASLASLPDLIQARLDGSASSWLIHERDLDAAQGGLSDGAERVSLLPVLDPYLQSYRDRERCVDPQDLPFVVDRSGNATSVIVIGGRVAGVWDTVAKPSPQLRVCLFGSPSAATRARVLAAAGETAEFLTGNGASVVETDRMRPLVRGTAGAFLSPLRDAC